MGKIKSLADLKKIKEEQNAGIHLRTKGEDADKLVQVKVAMATCGIASGAKDTMDFLADSLEKRGIEGGELVDGIIPVNYETIDSKDKED